MLYHDMALVPDFQSGNIQGLAFLQTLPFYGWFILTLGIISGIIARTLVVKTHRYLSSKNHPNTIKGNFFPIFMTKRSAFYEFNLLTGKYSDDDYLKKLTNYYRISTLVFAVCLIYIFFLGIRFTLTYYL